MDKAGIANRLSRAGLRNAAEAFREEVRRRILRGQQKRDRDAASEGAWGEMWDLFRPLCERHEKKEEKKAAAKEEGRKRSAEEDIPILVGIPEDIEAILAADYSERDPGKRLRDGLLWAAEEWVRVIRATDSGAVATIDRASSPPPNAFALLILESYALAGADKRRELVGRALAFACKSHDSEPAVAPGSDSEGFLGEIS